MSEDKTSIWPFDGLESVSACPVCASSARDVLHEGLTDLVFGAAPGAWTLKQCCGCRSAYLDPRPTKATIGLAYSRYYTHEEVDTARTSRIMHFARAALNGYANVRYGSRLPHASRTGGIFVRLIPPLAQYFDAELRHLKAASPTSNRLLDVGSGNGRFMRFAQSVGWAATGVEPDQRAVQTARSLGLDIRHGTLDLFESEREIYDLITVSHVIEHVHEPGRLLEQCFRLLKPGGELWLETPNIDAEGHRRFGRNWRGLEPPRHLVLFSQMSLTNLLTETGFENVRFYNRGLNIAFTYLESRRMTQHSRLSRPIAESYRALLYPVDFVKEYVSPSVREFLTVTAVRSRNSDG